MTPAPLIKTYRAGDDNPVPLGIDEYLQHKNVFIGLGGAFGVAR